MSRMERPDIEEQIRDRLHEWATAVRTQDEKLLEEILADEFVVISARLGIQDRVRWLGIIPDYAITEFAFEDITVYVYGDAAVSNSRYSQSGRWLEEDVGLHFYLTDVWVFRDGRWQVVTRHASVVPREPA